MFERLSIGRGRLHRFFRATADPFDLAILRIVVFGTLFCVGFSDPNDVRWFASLPADLFLPPPGWSALFPLLPRDPVFASILRSVFLASCATAAVGLWTRTSSLVVLVSGLYVLGLPQFLGKLNHYHHLWWMAAILAASPAGDTLSIDRLATSASSRRKFPAPSSAIRYGMPLRFVWVLIGIVYLFPGLWKLGSCGLNWALGDNLRWLIYQKWLELGEFAPLYNLDRFPWLFRFLALFTLIFEVGFLPALFFRRVRPWFIATGLAFHLGTWFFMRINFGALMICYVAFVPWSKLRQWVLARLYRTRPAGPLSPSLPAGTPPNSPRAMQAVGSVLVAILFIFGALGIDSWPFAVYPRFNYFASQSAETLNIEVLGSSEPYRDETLIRRFGSSRWFYLQRRLIRESENEDLWSAFHQLTTRESGSSHTGFRYWKELWSVASAIQLRNPTSRELLHEVAGQPP